MEEALRLTRLLLLWLTTHDRLHRQTNRVGRRFPACKGARSKPKRFRRAAGFLAYSTEHQRMRRTHLARRSGIRALHLCGKRAAHVFLRRGLPEVKPKNGLGQHFSLRGRLRGALIPA
jgi:hypothetical protein